MLHKGYDNKGSDAKNYFGRELQGVWLQDELIGKKLQVVK
jgi:hypothetical protein